MGVREPYRKEYRWMRDALRGEGRPLSKVDGLSLRPTLRGTLLVLEAEGEFLPRTHRPLESLG